MFKRMGSLFATLLGGLLLVYSATRSLDFIMLTLPPDKQILAYFGLAALDGGLVAWMLSYLYGSRGSWQRAIGLIMVIVDFVGAVAMFTLDTIYNTGQAGLTGALSQNDMQTAILALSAIIAMNIAATVGHHLTDPETMKRIAEENVQAEITDQTLALIAQNSKALAATIGPQMADEYTKQMMAEYSTTLKTKRRRRELVASTPEDIQPQPENAGKSSETGIEIASIPNPTTRQHRL